MINLLAEKNTKVFMSSNGLNRFRRARLTKVQPDGTERFYIHDNKPDPDGRRVYCVIAQNMTLNDLCALNNNELMFVKLKFGDALITEDWTASFNIQPHNLHDVNNGHIYGSSLHKGLDFEKLMAIPISQLTDSTEF